VSRENGGRRAIYLVAVGPAGIGVETLDSLAADLARVFEVSCHVRTDRFDAAFAHDAARNQYHSTAILAALDRLVQPRDVRVLGVTALDLFVPVLTFVFGEAQLAGRCAVVSTHRLREEHYGLPAREEVLRQRLTKEAVHELGHTFGLRHCPNWRCVMASTHAVERLDLKEAEFCASCRCAVA
jgi:archaemetzincin